MLNSKFDCGLALAFASPAAVINRTRNTTLRSDNCESGGIGRRAGLRIQSRKGWGFNSPLSHHEIPCYMSKVGSGCQAGNEPDLVFSDSEEIKLTAEIVEISSCKKSLVVEVPSAEIDQEVDKMARQYARTARVPGFRPGKVPLSIIKQRYQSEMRKDVIHDVIQRSWKEAVEKHDLRALEEPAVQEVKDDPATSLKFTLVFEILPAIEIADYKGVSASLAPIPVEDTDVDKTLEELREHNAQFIPVDSDTIKDGHYVTMTVDGTFEDATKPLHEEDATCIVGHPSTNAEFSTNLRGKKPGETCNFDMTYPADYHRKRFSGKTIHYSVAIRDVKEKVLPELNDEFAKDLGAENLEALKMRIKDDLITKARENAEKKAKESVLDEIVRRHSFEIPDCLVQDELEAHGRRLASNLAHQGIDVNKTSINWKKIFEEERPHAEQAVRRSIVLDYIARREGIDVTDEEIDAGLQPLAEGTNRTVAALRSQLEKDKRIQGFRENLRQNKALDFIYRNANISGG